MENITPGVTRQISWVYTEDLDSTAVFYAETLGLTCLRESGGARLYATSTNACIGLCQVFADRVVEPTGAMISLVTDDVDAWYQRLHARGADLVQAPERLERFGIYRFSLRDPNGYVIEIQQFDEVLSAQAASR